MNTKTVAPGAWNPGLKPHRMTLTPKPPRIVGLIARPPADWSDEKARIYVSVERSLLHHPDLRHLSVLPAECLVPVMEIAPTVH